MVVHPRFWPRHDFKAIRPVVFVFGFLKAGVSSWSTWTSVGVAVR
jgi:hypothetical protein